LFGEPLHRGGDDGEAGAGGAGMRGLDRGIEREQLGLVGDAAHRGAGFLHALNGRRHFADRFLEGDGAVAERFDLGDRIGQRGRHMSGTVTQGFFRRVGGRARRGHGR